MKKLILSVPLLIFTTLAFGAYEDHFPTYFEYCSGTQWKLQNGEEGGTPGHGFTYIHGLCKDYTSEYPQVIPCSEAKSANKAYIHEGVGISLDKNFTNVMWVAVPGKSLMFFGEKDRRAITNADVQDQVDRINELKVFNEVKSKSDALKTLTFGTPEYLAAIAKDTIGTDHAVNWARELHCVKVPFPQDKLKNVAKFLNDSNNQYKAGPAEYEWSKLSNNCVHLSINQSHALGINKSIKVDAKFLGLLTNVALPANSFLMYADQLVLKKAPSKRKLKKSLEEKNFHQVQVGALMSTYDAYPTGDYFKTDDLTVLTAPRILKPLKLLSTPRKYEKKYMTPENTELKANAEMWIKRYEDLMADLDKGEAGSQLGTYLSQQIELSKKIAEEE